MSAMIDNLRDYLLIIDVSGGLIDIFLRVQVPLPANQELEAISGGGGARVEKSCSWGCVCKQSLPHEVGYPKE